MYCLKEYFYDYYEWEKVIAVSKDKKKLKKEYCKLYPNKSVELVDEKLHKDFKSREETHCCIEKIKYLE